MCIRTTRLAFTVLAAAFAVLDCASAVPAIEGDAPATASRAPEIMRLRTRNGDVAILARGGGHRISVFDASENAVMEDVEMDRLRGSDPALYEMLTTSVASSGTYLDARLSLPAAPER